MFLGDIFRKLFRVKKMNSLMELCAYIHKGDLFDLSRWIEWRTPYKKDRTLKDEWESPDVAIKRGSCDCEEKATIAVGVVKSWGREWTADALVVANSTPGKAHAVCAWRDGIERGILDDGSVKRYINSYPIERIVREIWPTCTYFYMADSKGNCLGERVYL